MSNKRYKYIPSGNLYKPYDMEAKTDNEYIVSYNINNISYLYNHLSIVEEWIENLPNIDDLSGYYTKNDVDTLLLNKLDNTRDNLTLYQSAEFGYTEDASPFIKKTDNNTNNYTEFRLLTDGAHLLQNGETYIAQTADEIVVKELLDENIETINNSLTEITENVSSNTDEIALISGSLDDLEVKVETNTTDIATNVASINTLNNIITAAFDTDGRYTIMGQSLSDGAGEVRFNLVEQVPLDSQYVTVSLTPNQFVNLNDGKITFNIIADGIINNEAVDLTLKLNIYKNDIVYDAESKVVEAGKTVSINFAGTFDVIANDIVYATLQIIGGTGTLTTNNLVVIAIKFASTNSNTAIKSSQIINDYTDLPNNGINPKLNQIDSNTTAISTNSGDITSILNSIDITNQNVDKINETKIFLNQSTAISVPVTLDESFRNFQTLSLRYKFDEYTFIKDFDTSLINTNTKIVIFNSYDTNMYIYFDTNFLFWFELDGEPSGTASLFSINKLVGKNRIAG